jgi:hypothetical protein
MVRTMFSGFPDVNIFFDNPVIITQRRESSETLIEDLTHPKEAKMEDYPEGSYGYSQLHDLSMKFGTPVVLMKMFIKKHRDSQYWNKEDTGVYYVTGYLNGKLEMNATIHADPITWRLYMPSSSITLDRLVFPPGLDIDNLYVRIDKKIGDIDLLE